MSVHAHRPTNPPHAQTHGAERQPAIFRTDPLRTINNPHLARCMRPKTPSSVHETCPPSTNGVSEKTQNPCH